MISTPLPFNEKSRLKALNGYNLLNSLPEEDFDNITYPASEICQTPISFISLVDKNRPFFKTPMGLSTTETSRDLSFCAHANNQLKLIFEAKDIRLDERLHDNALLSGMPNISFYVDIPSLDADGFTLVSLCVIDEKPGKLNDEQKEALTKLSKQVMCIIEASQKKKVEEDLKLVDFIIKNSAMPIFLIKEDSSIYNLNESAARVFGYTHEELMDKKIIELNDDFDKHKWALHWEDIKAKGSKTFETTTTKKMEQ
jgi:PAS domain S-box-containing protein